MTSPSTKAPSPPTSTLWNASARTASRSRAWETWRRRAGCWINWKGPRERRQRRGPNPGGAECEERRKKPDEDPASHSAARTSHATRGSLVQTLLALTGIRKAFSGVQALKGVSLDL